MLYLYFKTNLTALYNIYFFYKKYIFNNNNNNNNKILNKYNLERDLKNHLIRVQIYAETLADLMCIDNSKIKFIKLGALLHDIGKTLINRNILYKPSTLNLEEFNFIKEHPKLGLKILDKKYEHGIIENIILFHHEKWDGSGYPFGLRGKHIPLEARIVSVVDSYDALTSNRVYRKQISHKDALDILKNESGISFDPDIISMFEIFENKFKNISDSYNTKA